MSAITILVADDHPVVREGLAKIISMEPDLTIVGEAINGSDAIELAERLSPRVVLMDVRMDGLDGVEATRRIRQLCPHTEVIVLSNYDEEHFVLQAVRAVRAGAKGYLLKDVPAARLTDAIRCVARGEATLDGPVVSRLVREFQLNGARPSEGTDKLTPRELEVLQCLTDGLSNQEIASRLVVSEKTVKSHLTSIYRKMNVRGRSQAILAALRDGLAQAPIAGAS